jgi:hypothetical protein
VRGLHRPRPGQRVPLENAPGTSGNRRGERSRAGAPVSAGSGRAVHAWRRSGGGVIHQPRPVAANAVVTSRRFVVAAPSEDGPGAARRRRRPHASILPGSSPLCSAPLRRGDARHAGEHHERREQDEAKRRVAVVGRRGHERDGDHRHDVRGPLQEGERGRTPLGGQALRGVDHNRVGCREPCTQARREYGERRLPRGR